MTRTAIGEFLARELDESTRRQLLGAIEVLRSGQRYFTYNTFNVRLDADTSTATVEDELDVTRHSALTFREFAALISGAHSED